MNEKITALIKYAIACLSLIVVAIAGYYAGGIVKYFLDIRKAEKVTENFQRLLEEPYRKDTYGGKTPEDTWAMFIEALKKEDIDLAIMYYAVGAGTAGRVPVDNIYKKKQDGSLQEWIKELETLEKDEQQPLSKDERYYFYDYFNEEFKQVLSSSVVFYLNPHTKIWKITNM